jgi:hypothetical protein
MKDKKLFFGLSLLELSYVPTEIIMKWKWLNHTPDTMKRFKIGLDRGWIIVSYKNTWKFWEIYALEIVELLCYESFWVNHSSRDITIDSAEIMDRLVYSGLSEPLKYINWKRISSWYDVKRYKPWAMNILKYPLPYNLRKELAPWTVKDWVEENHAIEVYKTDPSPKVCLIYPEDTEAIAWYSNFLSSSWVFHLEDTTRKVFKDQFFRQYILFLTKHNALYMLVYGTKSRIESNSLKIRMKNLMGIKNYTGADLEREKQADPKRYELWKKHFGEINY